MVIKAGVPQLQYPGLPGESFPHSTFLLKSDIMVPVKIEHQFHSCRQEYTYHERPARYTEDDRGGTGHRGQFAAPTPGGIYWAGENQGKPEHTTGGCSPS